MIGAGGGRDVLSALAFGARSVTAVEINKDIIRTVNGRFGDFTGHLDRDPRVRFVNDEARSFVARSPDRFGTIQISLIDTWAATAAGAFVLGENSLYTVEAWTTFLNHLTDDGLLIGVALVLPRAGPAELYRTTTIAVEALRRLGVTEPRRHIAIVRHMQPRATGQPRRPTASAPFSSADGRSPTTSSTRSIEKPRGSQFDVPFSPRVALDETFVRLTRRDGLEAFLDFYPINIAAPTDDSPFFFNMLRLRDMAGTSLLDFGSLEPQHEGRRDARRRCSSP